MKTDVQHKPLQHKRKIAVLSRHFTTIGGAERYSVEIAKLLAKDNDVHVFAYDFDASLCASLTYHKIPCVIKKPRFISQWLYALLTWFYTRNHFDIVYSHEAVLHANFYVVHCYCFKSSLFRNLSAFSRLLKRIRTALNPRKSAYLLLESIMYRPKRDKRIIVVSNLLKRDIQETYPLGEEMFITAYPGVDIHRFKPNAEQKSLARNYYQLQDNQFVILFVATHFARKGLKTLLHAFAKLLPDAASDLQLVIAGNDDKKPYVNLAEHLNISSQVKFVGKITELENFYPIADILVVPTLSDTWGLVPLEGMACGLPVILSNKYFAGIAECITDQALLLDDPRDADELAEKIKALFTQPLLRASYAEKARRFAEQLTWQHTFNQTKQAFE